MSPCTCNWLREYAAKQGLSVYQVIEKAFYRYQCGYTLMIPLRPYSSIEQATAAYKAAKLDLFRHAYQGENMPPIPSPPCLPAKSAGTWTPASTGAVAINITDAERVAQAAAALVQAERVKAENEAAAAFAARIQRDINLAAATSVLLNTIQGASTGLAALGTPVHPLAAFRKELQPLANSYGFKIVLVGDRSKAMLVQQ